MEATIEQERVRARVSEYIANRGYVRERTFGPERLGLDGFPLNDRAEMLGLRTYSFWDGISILRDLQELFKPVREVYEEGKSLYAKATVLTPLYAQFVDVREERKKEIAEARWWKRIGFWLNFEFDLDHNIFYCTPPMVSEEESGRALQGLYSLLQEDGRDVTIPSLLEDASERETATYNIKRDLPKIKNHTAIVCLDQLQKEGLNLDERISVELKRIPSEFLKDAYFWNDNVSAPFRLRNGSCLFGKGLF